MNRYEIAKMFDARKVAKQIFPADEIVERAGRMYVACPAHSSVLGRNDNHPSAQVREGGCYCWSCQTFTSTIKMIRYKKPDVDPYKFAADICGISLDGMNEECDHFYVDETSLRNAGYAGHVPENEGELQNIVIRMRKVLDDVEKKYCTIESDGIGEVMDLLGSEYDFKKILDLKIEIEKRRSYLDRLAR